MKREPLSSDAFMKIVRNYLKDDIFISNHYNDNLNKGKREIAEETIKEYLTSQEPFLAEAQLKDGEKRLKAIYTLSNSYDLIIVVAEETPKSLKVITSYKSSKRIKRLWQKKSTSTMNR